MSSLNYINRTKYMLVSTSETNDLLMGNVLLIFMYGKYPERH